MRSLNYDLIFVLIQQTQSCSFLIQLETGMQGLRKFERKFMWQKNLKMSWLEHILKFNKRGCGIRMSWVEKFLKINEQERGWKITKGMHQIS